MWEWRSQALIYGVHFSLPFGILQTATAISCHFWVFMILQLEHFDSHNRNRVTFRKCTLRWAGKWDPPGWLMNGVPRAVWPASPAELCPSCTPWLDAVFVSEATACQAWTFCLAVTWGWGKRHVVKYQTVFHVVVLDRLEIGKDRARGLAGIPPWP